MTEPRTPAPLLLRSSELLRREVLDRAGEKVGGVSDLLLDEDGRVSLVEVEFGLPRRHVLIPERELDRGEKAFLLNRWTREQARSLPLVDREVPLDERALRELRGGYPWFYGDDEEWRGDAGGEGRAVPLSEAKDFRLESGAPDLRGWTVFGVDGERVGVVKDILVDPAAQKVRYLSVDVLDDLYLLKDDRHVLVPLEDVELKERGNDAWVQRARAREIASLPAYTGGPVGPAMERAVQRVFG
jgi:sporulation protein YlmC with PRC-barrel domain